MISIARARSAVAPRTASSTNFSSFTNSSTNSRALIFSKFSERGLRCSVSAAAKSSIFSSAGFASTVGTFVHLRGQPRCTKFGCAFRVSYSHVRQSLLQAATKRVGVNRIAIKKSADQYDFWREQMQAIRHSPRCIQSTLARLPQEFRLPAHRRPPLLQRRPVPASRLPFCRPSAPNERAR